VGNFEELLPYFVGWGTRVEVSGLLMAFAVEQDSDDDDVPFIPKGTDGRALR
jgi:hypothetical protein